MAKRNIPIPSFETPIIETHFHLDYLKHDVDKVLAESMEAGVEKFITVGVEPANQDAALELAEKFENVFCTQGIHPHEAKLWCDEVEKKIISNCTSKKVVAIGECGLDYHYTRSPKEDQIKAFERQLELSAKLELPVVIHTREAEEDTKAILKNHLSSLKYGAVIHCYTSNMDLATFALENEIHLGFNGILTFNQGGNVREVLEATPLDKILLETDAPFLTPIPYRGRENSPKYIPFIALKAAEIKGIEPEELLKAVYKNSVNLFHL